MFSLLIKSNHLFWLLFAKLSGFSHISFPWNKCWNIRIRKGFEIWQFPLQGITTSPITIGNDVWIGYGVVITKGVVIGDGCVIGANSVVTHDIPPYSVAAGVPTRIIKKRGKCS